VIQVQGRDSKGGMRYSIALYLDEERLEVVGVSAGGTSEVEVWWGSSRVDNGGGRDVGVGGFVAFPSARGLTHVGSLKIFQCLLGGRFLKS